MKKLMVVSMLMLLSACGGKPTTAAAISRVLAGCVSVGDTLTVTATANTWGDTISATCTTVGREPITEETMGEDNES